MPRTEWKKAYDYLGGRLLDMERTEGAVLSGKSLKQLDSEIGDHARNLAKSQDPLQRVTAEAWFTVQDGLRDAMQLGAKGDAAEKVAAANLAYKNLIPIRKALGNSDIATPRVLRRAMEHTTHPSKGLVEAANQTLPNTVPSSGTVERAIALALPATLMGGGYGAQQFGFDMLGGGAIAAGALGTRTGSKLMTGAYPWQRSQMLVDALRKTPVAATRKDKQ